MGFFFGNRCCCGCFECGDFDAEQWATDHLICDRALQETDTQNPLYGPSNFGSLISTDCGFRIPAWQFIRYFGSYDPGTDRCTGVIRFSYVYQDSDGWRYYRSPQYKTRGGDPVYMFGRSHACESNPSSALSQWWISSNLDDFTPPACTDPGGDYFPIWEMDSTYDPDVETDVIYRIDHKFGTQGIATGWKFKGHNWPKWFYGPIEKYVFDNFDVLQSGLIIVSNNVGGVWSVAGTIDCAQKTGIPWKPSPSCQDGDYLFPFGGSSGVNGESGYDCVNHTYAEFIAYVSLYTTYYHKQNAVEAPPFDQLSLGIHDESGLQSESNGACRFHLAPVSKADNLASFDNFSLYIARTYGLTYRPLVQLFRGEFDIDGAGYFEDLEPVNKTVTGAASRFEFQDVIPGSFEVIETVYSQVD